MSALMYSPPLGTGCGEVFFDLTEMIKFWINDSSILLLGHSKPFAWLLVTYSNLQLASFILLSLSCPVRGWISELLQLFIIHLEHQQIIYIEAPVFQLCLAGSLLPSSRCVWLVWQEGLHITYYTLLSGLC